MKAQVDALGGKVRVLEAAASRDPGSEGAQQSEGGGGAPEADLRPVWERIEAVWLAVEGGRDEQVRVRGEVERLGRVSRELLGVRGDVERVSAKVDGYFGVWSEESEGTARQLRDLWGQVSVRRAAESSVAERVQRELGLTPIKVATPSRQSPLAPPREAAGAGSRGMRAPREVRKL